MTSSSSTATRAAATAADAWDLLQQRGLEIPGRDGDLAELLHRALQESLDNGPASSFEQALASASLEQFVRAFFQSAAPYVDMLKDILWWFEQADARQGPRGWKLAWGGGDIPQLQYFRQWLRELETRSVVLDCPALGFDDAWTLIEILTQAPGAQQAQALLLRGNYRALPASVQNFAYYYKYGYDKPLPLAPPPGAPAWLTDLWTLLRCARLQLERAGIEGQCGARERARALQYATTQEDGLAVDSLCMLETDLWLLQLAACLGALLESPADQALVAHDMEHFLGALHSRSFIADETLESLTAFVDLPLWGHRHAFYSAWIASKIIDACAEHEQHLVHEHGVIALPFKRTEVAQVLTARPRRTLFSERRAPLANPQGKGRSQNVQPDFSIWHSTPSGEVCDLVVEVKHYLSPAKKSWAHVMEDYAQAHPAATVVLINYGAPGNAMSAVRSGIAGRCRLIGNCRPGRGAAIDELSALVQQAVGPVWRTATRSSQAAGQPPALVVLDRSHSMTLAHDARAALIGQLVDAFHASHVAVATYDANVLWHASLEGIDAAAGYQGNGEGRFTEILLKFLVLFPELVFITDADGSSYLDQTRLDVHAVASAFDGVSVLQIRQRSAEAPGARPSGASVLR